MIDEKALAKTVQFLKNAFEEGDEEHVYNLLKAALLTSFLGGCTFTLNNIDKKTVEVEFSNN